MVVSIANQIIFFILSVVLTFVFSSRVNIFNNDLRKHFSSSSPSSRSSNFLLTLLHQAFIASKTTSVASLLSLSSPRCSSNLLVISSSIRQPLNSTISFISMSSKRLSGCFLCLPLRLFWPIISCFLVVVVIMSIYILRVHLKFTSLRNWFI